MISLWDNLMLLTKKLRKGGFQAMRGPPRAQRVPKMENIVCHEKTRLNILLQDDFGKLGVTHIKGGQRNNE